jgi:hypothetical protein
MIAHSIPTVVRREKTWANRYLGQYVLHRRFLKTREVGEDLTPVAREVLEAYLGMTALVLKYNDVMVNRKQLMLFFNKAGARAIIRQMTFVGHEEHAEDRIYRWRPSPGTITAVGAIVNDRIAYEFGKLWWKRVEIAVATLGLPGDGDTQSN